MKIAFVGKGGAGKTTLSSLFAQYQSRYEPTLAVDADVNMHMSELLSGQRAKKDMLISEKKPSDAIRTYLRGANSRIASNDHFKKSTPPGLGSNLVDITNKQDWLLVNFSQTINERLSLVTVGTYSEEGVASSCYHNNLSILENILSHTAGRGVIVADMVAGTDAFATTLFSQFDVLTFVVEPTVRSLAVFEQYQRLAQSSGVEGRLFVVANKIENEEDYAFIVSRIPANKVVGCISRSGHLIKVDKGQEALNIDQLTSAESMVFERLAALLKTHTIPMQARLKDLWELHKIYVNQDFVKDRFGDLTNQIDADFQYPLYE